MNRSLIVLAALGHASVPLVSLAVRRAWSDGMKLLAALVLSAAAAAVMTITTSGLSWSLLYPSFMTVFGTQQITWGIGDVLQKYGLGKLALAGAPALNEKLLDAHVLPAREEGPPGEADGPAAGEDPDDGILSDHDLD